MRRVLLVLVLALAAPAAASAATPWVGLQPVSGLSPAGTYGPMGCCSVYDLAVNGSGAAAAAWVDANHRVLVSRRLPSGTWSSPDIVSPTFTAVNNVSIAIDAAGDVTVVWATATAFMSTSAPAGAAFAAPQVIQAGFTSLSTPDMDVVMNAAGETVVAFAAGGPADAMYATTAPTAGAAWAAAAQISQATGGENPSVAINSAGDAIAVFNQVNGVTNSVRGALVRPAATFTAGSAIVFSDTSATAVPQAVMDKDGNAAVLVRTLTAPAGTADDDSVIVVRRDKANDNFTATVPGDKVAAGCNIGGADNRGRLLTDTSGTVTAIFKCNGAVYSASRPAAGNFSGTAFKITDAPSLGVLVADSTPGGKQLVVLSDSGIRAYRRASTADAFGTAEGLLEPDPGTYLLQDAGLDDAGDAVALLGGYRFLTGGGPAVDELSSLLDVTPGTASINGPTTAMTGDLVTYTFTGTDPFGGFGAPSWQISDGTTSADATYKRTFTTAGTYEIKVTATDVGGHVATATKTLVVSAPGATPTPTASATATPTASSVPTATPTASPTATPTATVTPPPVVCVVPKLKGKTVAQARKALEKAHCKLGKVKKPKHHGKKIAKQGTTKKTVLPEGSTVKITLKKKR